MSRFLVRTSLSHDTMISAYLSTIEAALLGINISCGQSFGDQIEETVRERKPEEQ